MNKKTKVFILIGLLYSGYAFLLNADNISFSADIMKADLARGRERTILTGNAYLRSDDIEIRAYKIELYGEDFNFASCEGNVEILNQTDKIKINSERLYFDRKEKLLRIHGNAVMEDRENEIIIKGGVIENRDKENITIIQIGARILKENMVCRAQMARYFREEQKLELYGNPLVIKDGDEYRATRIIINLENDEVILEGDVQAEMEYETEDE